jgi:acyl-CoA thioester hydrolase
MQKMAHKNIFALRTRVKESDALGVVYYSNLFVYFEVARTEFLKSIGCNEEELRNCFMTNYIMEAHCNYKSPIFLLDEIEIETQVSDLKEKTLKFSYKVSNKTTNKDVADGYTVGIFVNENKKSIKIPEWFLRKLNGVT